MDGLSVDKALENEVTIKAVIGIISAVGDAIRELGEVPSGHLYANLMARMEFSTYEMVISSLKNAGLVTETGFILKWVGPAK